MCVAVGAGLHLRLAMRGSASRFGQAGFTLIEVLFAALLLAAISAGVAHLFVVGSRSMHAARLQTSTALLAAAKLEQLRALAWSYEPASDPPLPRSDVSTDVSLEIPPPGGAGLSASPAGSLAANTSGYVDYLDAQGRWIGNGTSTPANAAFIRRWSVMPLPQDPARCLVLAVLVTTVGQDRSRGETWTARAGDETLLVLLRTREGL